MKNLVITPELRLLLELLASIDPEYVTDLILALIETLNGIKQDPDEMPTAVRKCFIYWMNDRMISIIKAE